MPQHLESELRTRLRADAANVDLAPGAAARAAELGHRRIVRRRAVLGGTAALAVAAAGLAVVPRLHRDAGGETVTVTSAGQPPGVRSARPAPHMLTRGADQPKVSLLASLQGTSLVVTPDNCIAVGDAKSWTGVIWGYGWTARWDDGKAVVVDPSGKIFAREGDTVALGGGGVDGREGPPAQYGDTPCWTDTMWSAND